MVAESYYNNVTDERPREGVSGVHRVGTPLPRGRGSVTHLKTFNAQNRAATDRAAIARERFAREKPLKFGRTTL